jgi:acyl-CoA dehydrogenase
MNFDMTPRAAELYARVEEFLDEVFLPAEGEFHAQLAAADHPFDDPPLLEELKVEARKRGLWNLFLPHATEWNEGLSNLDYAPLAELTGRCLIASEAMNCWAPDTGNMEILTLFGTPDQRDQWLRPLLEGEIRSCFAMTEPEVASSDATNIATSITADGDEYVINGHKWFISGAMRTRCRIMIVMGKTDPEAEPHRQQSMVLVPMDTPGIRLVRSLSVFGYVDRESHAEIFFDDVRVPRTNLLAEEGGGFVIAQARLGPGRVHHCMRTIGAAERALELMCQRVGGRVAFGLPLADQGVIQEWIADSRAEIDQARLLTLHAAWLMDQRGNQAARKEVALIKFVVPAMALRVIDRAIQAHGAAGVSQDTPLAASYAFIRTLRIADGPDEVHRRTVARLELRDQAR